MIRTRKTAVTNLNKMTKDYYKNLTAPMDDFWENGIFPKCDFYLIIENNEKIGFFSLDKEKILNQFYLINKAKYKFVLKEILCIHQIKKAYASSYDPLFLEACKQYSHQLSTNTILYIERKTHKAISPFKNIKYKLAKLSDLKKVIDYSNKAGVGGEWIKGYYQGIIKDNGLTLFTINDVIIGTGESRESQTSKGYTNIGMTVAKEYRRKGIATYIINTMREIVNSKASKTICSTSIDNIASQKTLTKCGYNQYHTIYNIMF